MQKHTRLQEYIVRNFIITIVCVSLVENVISYVANRWIFPVIEVLQNNGTGIGKLTLGQISAFLGVEFIQAALRIIGSVIPKELRGMLYSSADRVEAYAFDAFPKLGEQVMNSEFSTQRLAQFIIVLAIILFVYLIPYIIGIVIFSGTVLKKVAQLEQKQEEERMEYDRKRNLMLSDIAHDLRTPMTTINGYAKAINDGMVKDLEKQREYLDIMQIKAKRMNDLVELLFEYVKLDSEGFKLEKEQIDLAELLRENAALMYSDIEEAGMELEIDIPEEKFEINADKLQISRVITNLLVNAVRHNKPDTAIKIAMKCYPGIAVIDIADNGDEIPKHIEKNIFEPFAKGDESRGKHGGSGLGLSIAKKVVNMHGWELKLNSDYPEYTKAFEITIPISENEQI